MRLRLCALAHVAAIPTPLLLHAASPTALPHGNPCGDDFKLPLPHRPLELAS